MLIFRFLPPSSRLLISLLFRIFLPISFILLDFLFFTVYLPLHLPPFYLLLFLPPLLFLRLHLYLFPISFYFTFSSSSSLSPNPPTSVWILPLHFFFGIFVIHFFKNRLFFLHSSSSACPFFFFLLIYSFFLFLPLVSILSSLIPLCKFILLSLTSHLRRLVFVFLFPPHLSESPWSRRDIWYKLKLFIYFDDRKWILEQPNARFFSTFANIIIFPLLLHFFPFPSKINCTLCPRWAWPAPHRWCCLGCYIAFILSFLTYFPYPHHFLQLTVNVDVVYL